MIVDFLGNQITAGCTIVYPVRRKSDMQLKRLTVTSVRPDELMGYNGDGRMIHVKSLDRVVVVIPPEAKRG